MRQNRILLGALLLCALLRREIGASPAVAGTGGTSAMQAPLLNLSYLPAKSSSPDPKNMLDLYLPAPQKPAVPLFIYIHGGAWVQGDKSQYAALGPPLAAHGVAVAIINYHLSGSGTGDVRHPAHAKDAAAAVAWLRKNAERYGYDPARIFLGGHSAGAQISAFLAYDSTFLAAVGEKPEALRGFVGIAGIYDLNALLRRFPAYGAEFLYSAFGTDEAAWRFASPKQLVTSGNGIARRPWLLVHSREDELVDIEQTEHFRKALEKQGVAVRFLTLPQGSHFYFLKELSSPTSLISQELLAFLRS